MNQTLPSHGLICREIGVVDVMFVTYNLVSLTGLPRKHIF